MFSTLRNRFGIPGVISVIALVFAMFGGAYAASSSSGGDKATSSAKAKKGPRGPKGATGPAGPAGLQGPAGASGKDGTNGTNGTPGAAGAPGKSVVVSDYIGSECETVTEEGAGVEVAGEPATTKYVCDGEEGSQGPAGSPWAVGGTLPPNATETGTWFFDNAHNKEPSFFGVVATTISFPVPLVAALAGEVHWVGVGEAAPSTCENSTHPGTASASNPEAATGQLCVYGGSLSNALSIDIETVIAPETPGANTFGAQLNAVVTGESTASGRGSWAVTGAAAG